MKRTVHYHAGPTNSGKTHNALEALMHAQSGLYCGPLRLLAVEVYERVNEQGVLCNLLTGSGSYMHTSFLTTYCCWLLTADVGCLC